MKNLTGEYIDVIRKAQQGDRASHAHLAEMVRGPLQAYVYRITLADDLSQDIVQESILEMLKVLGKLKRADRFWPWLCGIALNKIRRHYRTEHHQRSLAQARAAQVPEQHTDGDGLTNLVSQDLKKIVVSAMRQLKPRHREVLTMRCYEGMEYKQIAKLMECSEFGVRMLFYRAKKSLSRQLGRNGLNKGALLTALTLFGRMTAPTQATAAHISITPATLKVGAATGLAGIAASKTTLVTVSVAGILAVGSIVALPRTGTSPSPTSQTSSTARTGQFSPGTTSAYPGEYWYYFPRPAHETVMIRHMERSSTDQPALTRVLQNNRANYYFDKGKNTTFITNHRYWHPDLRVQRLPIDRPELTAFISQMEGSSYTWEPVENRSRGLLVIIRQNGSDQNPHIRTAYHPNILEEEYFQYHWPGGVEIVDQRDIIHQQGWCYFRVEGTLAGEIITGVGRLPLVYNTAGEFSPWLHLTLGQRGYLHDGIRGALLFDARTQRSYAYPSGSFFQGLARPWQGLHTLDTVRRDAARVQAPFTTRHVDNRSRAQVTITTNDARLIYTINLDKDMVETIAFLATDSPGHEREGMLTFTYYPDAGSQPELFKEPRSGPSPGTGRSARKNPGLLWLRDLGTGTLGT